MMNKPNMGKTAGFIMAALAGLFWGISGVIGQYLFEDKGVDSAWLVSYRMVLAGVILLVYLRCKKVDIMGVWKEKSDRNLLVIYSVFGMMMVQFSFFRAVETTNAGTGTVFQFLNPAMLLVYFAFKTKTLPNKKESLVVLMALVGTFFVATGGNIHSLTLSPIGLFWGLSVAFFSCVFAVLPIPLLKKFDARVICGWGMLIGGIVLSLFVRPWNIDVVVDVEVVGYMALLILIGTIIPFSFSLMAIPLIGPVKTNLLASFEPAGAAVISVLVLGTSFSPGEWLGFALIIGTVFVLAIQEKE